MQSPIGQAVTVAAITYRRPALLGALLQSLEAQQEAAGFKVLVVDNDPDQSARHTVESANCKASYISEPSPGIVAARNAVLSSLPPDCKHVIFIDDDETADEGWFNALLETARVYNADVVAGPVVTVFEPGCPRWIRSGGFIQRPRLATGTILKTAATNNVLISLESLRSLQDPRFSEDFSLTGGSDAELFWRMHRSGVRMVWCDEASVREAIPNSRANFRWIFRRTVRLGNVSGRLLQRTRPRGVVIVLGLGRTTVGILRILGSVLTGRGFRDADFSHFAKGIGMLGACLGTIVVEYKRAT